jgi:hypothetical protein
MATSTTPVNNPVTTLSQIILPKTYVNVVPQSERKISSVYQSSNLKYDFTTSTIDSVQGWSPSTANINNITSNPIYLELNLSKIII